MSSLTITLLSFRYYSGEKKAPILTVFIGGNHEASNHMQELPYGGWVAPNIYYLGMFLLPEHFACNPLDRKLPLKVVIRCASHSLVYLQADLLKV